MATPLSTVTNNTYIYNIHGDCQAVQIGTSNTFTETSNQSDPDDRTSDMEDFQTDNEDLTSDMEDVKFQMNRIKEQFERKDEEIAELKNRVADLEEFKKKVEQSEVKTNANTRRYIRDTSNDITLELVYGPYEDMGTITVSKKVSVNDLKKLIEEKKNKKISLTGIIGYRDGSGTWIYISLDNKNDYSLEQLGVVDQDQAYYY